MKESDIHGLIVLRYLQLGIVPYYPGHGVLAKPDIKTRRKFRKIWRKVAKELDMMDRLSSSGHDPSMGLKGYRQMIVYRWVRNKVIKNRK